MSLEKGTSDPVNCVVAGVAGAARVTTDRPKDRIPRDPPQPEKDERSKILIDAWTIMTTVCVILAWRSVLQNQLPWQTRSAIDNW